MRKLGLEQENFRSIISQNVKQNEGNPFRTMCIQNEYRDSRFRNWEFVDKSLPMDVHYNYKRSSASAPLRQQVDGRVLCVAEGVVRAMNGAPFRGD